MPNYLMAQVPTYPFGLLYPPPDVPGDFSGSDGTKTEPRPQSDLLIDALLFERLNEDRNARSAARASGGGSTPIFEDDMSFLSPYADPYTAQQQGQQGQQNSLQQAKQAWDLYRGYQNIFGNSGVAEAQGYGSVTPDAAAGLDLEGFGAAPYAGEYGGYDFSAYALPEMGSTELGGLGMGAGAAGGSTGLGAGATMTSIYGLPAAGSTSLAGTTGGAGAAAGGAGGLMGILGPLGVLGAFALLAYGHAEKTSKKDRAQREAGLPAWQAGEGRHITRLKSDPERLDWYHQLYG